MDEEISKYTGVVGRGLSTRAGWDEDVASLDRLHAKNSRSCDKIERVAPVLHAVPVQLPAPASQQWLGDSSTISYARVPVLQPGGSGDTSVNIVDTEPHLEALTQHVAGRLPIPGASAAAEVKILMDPGSGITAMSEELVEALRRQPGLSLIHI